MPRTQTLGPSPHLLAYTPNVVNVVNSFSSPQPAGSKSVLATAPDVDLDLAQFQVMLQLQLYVRIYRQMQIIEPTTPLSGPRL